MSISKNCAKMLEVVILSAVLICFSRFHTSLSQEAAALNSYGTCISIRNETGLCIHITDCPYLFDILNSTDLNDEQRVFLRQSQCGLDNTQTMPARRVLVCCPDNLSQNITCSGNHCIKAPIANNILPEAGICGNTLSNKILGGNNTQLDEFPWMALIEYTKPGNIRSHHCGGSLINSRYVLTAAHCVNGAQIPKTWQLTGVRLGEWDLNTDPDCEIDVRGRKDCALPHVDVGVVLSIPHPSYVPDSPDQLNDIALLRLSESVTFTDYVKPICLPLAPELRNIDLKDHILDVAGWGQTETKRSSSVKLKILVKVWPLNSCQEKYKSFQHVLTETQLCAGGEENIDTCRGDSGGPLMVKEILGKHGIYFMAGVVSYGPTPCGLNGWPGVYTKVSTYIDWIQASLEP